MRNDELSSDITEQDSSFKMEGTRSVKGSII